ncbi:MAG: diacylglycerol kinase family lipid kinase [Firmicutes bacterium]|nr:diacylglycerol kinase family lipid kinase [Bacillota bacterium]
MKHLFIINPVAGKGKTVEYIPKINEYFSGRNDIYFIETTRYPGHGVELVKQYVSRDTFRVYSVGGDGTLNEVLNGIVGSNSSLAVIPAGSGNDFFKSLTKYFVNKDLSGKQALKDKLLERLVNGKEFIVDMGKINGRYFINISSLGFDAEVAYKSHKIKKLPFISGLFAYILSVFATLLSYKSNQLKITIDGKTIEKDTLLVAVANGKYYGGGMQPAPSAEINDGFLNICLIEYVGRLKILKFLPRFIRGNHAEIKEVSFHRGKNVNIISKNKVAMNVDGETSIIEGKIDFEIIPSGIKIILPL